MAKNSILSIYIGLDSAFDATANGTHFSNTISTTIVPSATSNSTITGGRSNNDANNNRSNNNRSNNNSANSNNPNNNKPQLERKLLEQNLTIKKDAKVTAINVNFTTTGFADVFSKAIAENLNAGAGKVMAILGNVLEGVKVERTIPQGFFSVKELRGIEYVGYIIEKEVLIRGLGIWKKIDEYKILGASNQTFLDSRVVYGEIYRYRIKSIFRTTKKIVQKETIASDEILSNKISAEVDKNLDSFLKSNLLSSLNSLKPNIEVLLFDNYFAAYDGKQVRVYQKVAGTDNTVLFGQASVSNSQNERRNQDSHIQISQVKKVKETITYKSVYYESIISREWTYVETYENTPPPAPECLKINPNTLSNQIFISWLKPSNSQRDISAFRIYRRENLGEAWNLIKEVGELDINGDGIPDRTSIINNSPNMYIDKDVVLNKKYIYALTSVDIHNIESFLSVQIQAGLNPNFAVEKEEINLKWISGGGAKLDEVSFVYKKFLDRDEQLVAKSNIKITPNSHLKDAVKNFIIKVKSLDTHEVKEYVLRLINTKIG